MLQNNLDCYEKSAVQFNKRIGALTNYNECYEEEKKWN